jgi:Fic family protein
MSKPPDAEQLARLRRLAAMPDEEIDSSDMPAVADWSLAVRGGTPSDVRRKLAALGKLAGARPDARKSSPLAAFTRSIEEKRSELDRLVALAPGGLSNFEHVQDIELTYTSNAIEGNTLTAAETALVVEKGITIGGRPLKDHLEAIDHFEALRYVRSLARQAEPLTESDLRNLHRLVMLRSAPEIAGRYADQGRFVLTDTGRHGFPSPAEVPALMSDFAHWLNAVPATPATAFEAHRRLVDIHPFNDGNGRTARLLMSLILIRGGYPTVAVRPEDRAPYLEALQAAQAGRSTEAFDRLLYERLDTALGDSLSALRQALVPSQDSASRSG